MYGNEDAIGAALAAARVARGDLHVTTKVWNKKSSAGRDPQIVHATLKRLRLDHVDLYLVHWPARNMNLPAMFETLLGLKQEGRTRAIGVANFNIALLKTVVEEIKAPIACNQVEYHVMLDQTPLRKYLGGGSDSSGGLLSPGAGPGGLGRDAEAIGRKHPSAPRRWR